MSPLEQGKLQDATNSCTANHLICIYICSRASHVRRTRWLL